jgi:hypothetical protein
MDGSTDQDLSSKFIGLNHQLAVLPDETIAFCAYSSNGCDDIKEYQPGGVVRTLVNAGIALGGATTCHCGSIQHSRFDDTLIFSDLDSQSITKVNRTDGATVWTLNGAHPTFTGYTWMGSQHGFHVLSLDHILLFNNNSRNSTGNPGGTGNGSLAIEISLDLSAKKVSNVWSYTPTSALQNDVLGDVQRLPNGNTVVVFSMKGDLQEVDANGAVLSDWSLPEGGAFGYIEKRATLYGPPPR